MSATLYLKYRPQKTTELNLKEVRESLERILESKSIPHAWLLTGPRGTGKTSSARIIAKAINCKHKKGIEPCNECEMCREITDGTAVDVIEIDAASNRGIDEIRELREKVKLAPMQAKYKVYIIDEVHMLTTEAANALLKTLEEPPANTLFILCTTEADKLPETVVSRCTRIQFKKSSLSELRESLERVIKGENMEVENGAVDLISMAARGSFRDGIKILEQAAIGGIKITEEAVRQITGVIMAADPDNFIATLLNGQSQKCLDTIAELDKQGVNMRRFTELLAGGLRDKLLAEVKQVNSEKDKLIKLIEGLDRAYEQMKTAAVMQLPLEIWVIENSKIQIPSSNQSEPIKNIQTEKKVFEIKKEVVIEEVRGEVNPPMPMATAGQEGKYSLEDLVGKWPEIMKVVKPKNHSVEALLRSTKPLGFDGVALELEVFYKFHKDKLETEKCRQIVESSVSEVFGLNSTKLRLKLGQKSKAAKEEVTANVDEDIIKAAQEIFKVEAV
jgi:DNA polymerase III subunit gamma/tau